MKSINIDKLMGHLIGHLIGISDSYNKVTEDEFPEDYLKALAMLTMSIEYRL
jgi:hypothetical protein